MVHNGIEYGDMQLIAEAYDVLKTLGGLSNVQLAAVFDAWNQGELNSYLIEITAHIFRVRDPEGDGELVDQILDATAQKGTGKWTVEEASELGVPVPTISTSVDARAISYARDARLRASSLLPGPMPDATDRRHSAQLVEDVRAALYAAKACSYAQGFDMLRRASQAHGWGLRLGEIARIWQGGCIIRARFLGRIKAAYDRAPDLENLLLDETFRDELGARQRGFRAVVSMAAQAGLPVLGLSASLGYYDMTRRARLPANLTQAQRDYFGAHTYRRLDRDGDFHTVWSSDS
jgi:6-phosphogluconate dehydrogenase